MKKQYGRYVFETSNEDKVLFPASGITKGELIDYYERVADVMVPHLADRPLMLHRFPDGIAKDGFYQKQVGDYFPDWVATAHVKKEDGTQDLTVCSNQATLVYLANQGTVALHPWLSRKDRLDQPDMLVIDLDPPGGGFARVRRAARLCKRLLDELELASFLKTTGSKGVHIVVPLKRKESFDQVRAFARDTMEVLAARHPDELTTEVRKDKRKGRVYLDVARNAYAQTAVGPYSARALKGAPVATPIDWNELGRLDAQTFTIKNLFRRLSSIRDPWADMRRRAQSLGPARRRLERIREKEPT